MLVVVPAFAAGVRVPSQADHPGTETHIDADHGAHDGYVVTGDQRTESRAVPLPPLAAERPAIAAQPDSRRVTVGAADDRAPGLPPPKPATARSPPRSV